jgi:hypothetical protein
MHPHGFEIIVDLFLAVAAGEFVPREKRMPGCKKQPGEVGRPTFAATHERVWEYGSEF